MKRSKKNQTKSPQSTKKTLLLNESYKGRIAFGCYNRITLKRALKELLKQKQMRESSLEKIVCPTEDSSESRVDQQIKLRCRQLPNVIQELREAIMKQDWNYAVSLVMILCQPGLKYYTSIILKACFILLFNHPKSTYSLVQNFIRVTTGYILNEDINKYIKVLFCLRNSPLGPLESGKYIRKTGDYKVIRDPQFENLKRWMQIC